MDGHICIFNEVLALETFFLWPQTTARVMCELRVMLMTADLVSKQNSEMLFHSLIKP